MSRLGLVVIVAACGGKQTVNKPLPKTAPYLILFEQGKSWTLASASGSVTCKVEESKQVGDSLVSRVNCGGLLVGGTWVSTPAGLYHPYLPVDEPDELALLGVDDLLIAKNPAEREHSHVLEGGAQDSIEAFGFEGSWCVRQTTQLQNDYRSWVLCLDGTAITGASEVTGTGDKRQRSAYGRAPAETTAVEQEEGE